MTYASVASSPWLFLHNPFLLAAPLGYSPQPQLLPTSCRKNSIAEPLSASVQSRRKETRLLLDVVIVLVVVVVVVVVMVNSSSPVPVMEEALRRE